MLATLQKKLMKNVSNTSEKCLREKMLATLQKNVGKLMINVYEKKC
jgi:hypothetical protein